MNFPHPSIPPRLSLLTVNKQFFIINYEHLHICYLAVMKCIVYSYRKLQQVGQSSAFDQITDGTHHFARNERSLITQAHKKFYIRLIIKTCISIFHLHFEKNTKHGMDCLQISIPKKPKNSNMLLYIIAKIPNRDIITFSSKMLRKLSCQKQGKKGRMQN